MARVMVAEGGSDPNSQLAVGSAIGNRWASGKYGSTPFAVVSAPSQFSTWSDGAARRVDPNSPAYQVAKQIAADVLSGVAPDPTGGATHFYAPSGMPGGRPPSWAPPGGLNIGGNVFSAPEGPVTRKQQPAQQSEAPAMASANLKKWGLDDSEPAAAAPARAAPVSAAASLKKWGLDDDAQGTTPAAQPPAPTTVAKAAVTASSDAPAAGDTTAAVGRGLINGVPIAGPALLSGLNHVAAAARALKENVPYSQALDEVNRFSDATAQQNPGATNVGGVIGAVAGMAPAVALAPGALGMGAGGIAANSLIGAASGGAIGAADATARGENPIYGALAGGVGGGLGPAVGRGVGYIADRAASGIGNGANALMNYLRTGSGSGVPGVGRAAANLVNQVADPAEVGNALTVHGPLAMPLDVDPALTGLGRGLATMPGPEQAVVRNALIDRGNGAAARIDKQVADTVGPDQSAKSLNKAYEDIRTEHGNTSYPEVHANAPPLDASGVLDTIDRQLADATGPQKALLNRVRAELMDKANVTPAVTDPETGAEITPEVRTWSSKAIHNIRMDIDNVIKRGDTGLGVQPGTLSRTQGAAGALRTAVDDLLKADVPGMAEADARSALDANNQNAVAAGYEAFTGKPVHPTDFAAGRSDNPATNAAQNMGAAAAIHEKFGSNTQRDVVTLGKLLAGGVDGYPAQNMRTAFGDDPTNALLKTLDAERAFNDTQQVITRNSETVRGNEANKLLQRTDPGSLNLSSATATGLALQSAKAMANPIIRAIMESPDAPRNMELARILTAQGESAQNILAALTRLNSRSRAMTGLGAGARAALGGGVNRLMLGAGATNRP